MPRDKIILVIIPRIKEHATAVNLTLPKVNVKPPIPEIKITDIQPESENPIQADVYMPKQKPTPQEQIKVKKTDIKTKDSYIRSHVRSVTDIKAKP